MTTTVEKYFVDIRSYVNNDSVYIITATVVDTNIIKRISIKNAIIDSDGPIEIISVFGTQWHECPDKDRLAFEQFDRAISAYLIEVTKSCHPLDLMRHMVDKGFSFDYYPDRV